MALAKPLLRRDLHLGFAVVDVSAGVARLPLAVGHGAALGRAVP